MRGILLAGGTGTRLHPITFGISKHLVPVFDKPMIYYPLCTLMLAGIRDILVVTTPGDAMQYQRLLGDGSQFGINLTYAEQSIPNGVAEAFILGENHVGSQSVALILGDNIFSGPALSTQLGQHTEVDGGTIFRYWVKNPSAYGVVEFDDDGRVLSIEEKPRIPKSNYAVPGLYFYDNNVIAMAKELEPSQRGELEITDINRRYLELGLLHVQRLPEGTAWLDTGTFNDLNDASIYVRSTENLRGVKIGAPEEVAWRMGYLNDDELCRQADKLMNSGYGGYLLGILDRH